MKLMTAEGKIQQQFGVQTRVQTNNETFRREYLLQKADTNSYPANISNHHFKKMQELIPTTQRSPWEANKKWFCKDTAGD